MIILVKTPCIGVCSTGIGDTVCRGCKRFAHEVIHWNSYSQAQKRIIDNRLGNFLAQILQSKLRILDTSLLKSQLDMQQIVYAEDKSPYLWVYQLLRAGASQIDDPGQYGFSLDTQYRDIDLVALRKMIDDEYYLLSVAHYQRYFQQRSLAYGAVIDCE